jgi:hypothetical protein
MQQKSEVASTTVLVDSRAAESASVATRHTVVDGKDHKLVATRCQEPNRQTATTNNQSRSHTSLKPEAATTAQVVMYVATIKPVVGGAWIWIVRSCIRNEHLSLRNSYEWYILILCCIDYSVRSFHLY